MNIEIKKGIPKIEIPTELDLLKQENEVLKKRVEEAENAIMTLMDMSLL
jgi:hypothetical protein